MMSKEIITIGMADDHQMIRQSIKSLIEGNNQFKVIIEADNGKELIEKIESAQEVPAILLIDISMPVMNGYDTIAYLTHNHKDLKSIALSINDDFNSVFKMIENGAKAYLKKGCTTRELLNTISQVYHNGVYYDSFVTNSLIEYQHSSSELHSEESIIDKSLINKLTEREMEFILMACSDLTYKEIADKMQISPRTVDSHRVSVFYKLKIKSRIALVIFAMKSKIFTKKIIEQDSYK
jgi:two-component system invasion response regulator UvrY